MNKIHGSKEDKIVALLAYTEALMYEKNEKEQIQLQALEKYEKVKEVHDPKKKSKDQDIPEDIIETEETQRGLDISEVNRDDDENS